MKLFRWLDRTPFIVGDRFRRARFDRIAQAVRLAPGDRVLSIGCGDGRSWECFDPAHETVGLDLFPKARWSAPNFTYVQGDATKLPFEDDSFDVAVSIGVFEHIRPIEGLAKALSEAARVAKRVAIIVPSIATPIEPHFKAPAWQLGSVSFREWAIDAGLHPGRTGPGDLGRFERLLYLTDDAWLEFEATREGFRVERFWHVFPFVRNLMIVRS